MEDMEDLLSDIYEELEKFRSDFYRSEIGGLSSEIDKVNTNLVELIQLQRITNENLKSIGEIINSIDNKG